MTLAACGPYRLIEQVGEGGMGRVFRAEDSRAGTRVAVKILDDSRLGDPQVLSRFRREARIEAALRHPNIAAFHDFAEASLEMSDDGRRAKVFYLVIEWVPGEDLTVVLSSEAPIGIDRIVDLAGQVASALVAAHEAGVVHRDLKPSNIRITPEGRVKILDFGLAKILEDAELHRDHPPTFQTTIGSLLGTAPYMAPEQLFGRPVDTRTDLFALGVIMYQMGTGEVPFSGDNIVQVLQAVSTKVPVPPSELNPALTSAFDDLVLALLAKEPEARPPSAAAVVTALETLA